MHKPVLHRRYDLSLVTVIVASLLLATLPLAGSARVVNGYGLRDRASGPSANSFGRRQSADSPSVGRPRARMEAALHSSPVMFIENVGQFDERARFQVRGGDRTIWLAEDAIWVTVVERPHPSPRPPDGGPLSPLSQIWGKGEGLGERGEGLGVALKLTFPGANPHPRIEPFHRLDTVVSYFIGNDPAQWHPAVPVWGGVRYVDLYPGVDLEISGEKGHWTWRLVARSDAGGAKGASPLQDVRLRVEGAEQVVLDGDRLRLTTAVGEYTLPLLQVAGATGATLPRPTVAGNQVIAPFTTAPALLSTSAPLHPSTSAQGDLLYATFLGGSGDDYGDGIAVDGAGNAYVTGMTYFSDFPTTPGAFDTTYNGGGDVFVAKLNAAGTALLYATFLGGSHSDGGHGIAVDGAGNAYVTGWTRSSDFPATPGAFDTVLSGASDAFVAKLNTDGSALVYATFLGGNGHESGDGIAVDGAGNAYVTGTTNSTDFSTTSGFRFDINVFVAKLNADGSSLLYATFLGGSGGDGGNGIAVDGVGNAYVTGVTESSDFPTTPGAFDTTFNGLKDAFVAKLNTDGSALVYATFLGGGHFDEGYGIAVDGAGNAYVAGMTYSSDFPATPGAFDTSRNGYGDVFVAKLNAAGSALLYATFLGGSGDDYGYGIAVDGAGNAYVTGETDSSDFPTTQGAFDTTHNGYGDVFVAKLSADGTALRYATFLGGSSDDQGYGIALDGAGNAYVAGKTWSSDFPTTAGAFDTTYNGDGYYDGDAFVAKVAVGGGARATNDDFDYAHLIPEPPASGYPTQIMDLDTTNATVAPDDPDMGCGAGVNSHTLWFKLVPSYYGLVRVRTYSTLSEEGDSTYDTVLAVFTGQRGSLNRIACNDDAPGHGVLSELTFEAEAGQTYYIEVAAYDDSPGGILSLFVNYEVTPKAWTLMFYLAANNDLEEDLLYQRQSLIPAAKNLNVNIVVLWEGNFNSKYIIFTPWGGQVISKPDLNTGDPQTLRDFVTWAIQQYPANHYALIISNHGHGLSGTSVDFSSGRDWLTVKETSQALSSVHPKLDIIYMDACLMATLDSAYQLAPHAKYYVASESVAWGPTRYDYFITGMPAHRTEVPAIRSDTSAQELALAMAKSYVYQEKFTPQGKTPSTISVLDLSKITDVAVAASDLAGLLKNRMSTVKSTLNSIWQDVQRFHERGSLEITTEDRVADLYHFASLVSVRITDTDIQWAAQNLMNKINNAVVFNESWSGYPEGGNVYWYHGDAGEAQGISVFLPPPSKRECYYNGDWLDFASGTDWGCQGTTSISGASDSQAAATTFEWGPMLVVYLNQINPSAPENWELPEPVPKLTFYQVHLPLLLRESGGAPAPPPTPTPPSAQPTIRIEPASGPLGTRFTIYGSGFIPGEIVQQWVITPTGGRFDDPTPETVDSLGNYTSWIQIDTGPVGTYTLYARGSQSQQTVSAQFQVTSFGALGTGGTEGRVSQIGWGK